MRARGASALLGLLLGLVSLPALAQDEPPPEETVQPPFSARQIQEFTKAGRKYVFKVESLGEDPHYTVIEFVSVNDQGATMRQRELDKDKKPVGEDEPDEEVTWADLEGHARFPKAQTTVTEAEVTVPAGKFKCVVFTVREPEVVTTFAFAKDLPGAPIKVEAREGDKVMFSMVLQEHTNN